MSGRASYADSTFSVRTKPMTRMTRHDLGHGSVYWTGDVCCESRMVSVYRQLDRAYTRLDYWHNGRVHVRTFDRFIADRALARFARELIKDVRHD